MLQLTKRRVLIGVSLLVGALAISYRDIFQEPLRNVLSSSSSVDSNDDGLYSSDADPPIEVVIPSCPNIKFQPLPYKKAADPNAYCNLAYPSNTNLANLLDASYTCYQQNPSGGSHGREHIYEVQLIALFIDSLKGNPAIWNWGVYQSKFCDWVTKFLAKPYGGTSAPINYFLQCLPNDKNAGTYWMPWLESTSNGIKASAWSGKEIRQEATFRAYDNNKKVAVMRALAGVKSYMKNPKAQVSFGQQAQCMQNIWTQWHGVYQSDSSVDSTAKAFDVTQYYVKWIGNRVVYFNSNLETGIANMAQWWNADAGGQGMSELVNINWINLLSQGRTVNITGNDIITMWNSI